MTSLHSDDYADGRAPDTEAIVTPGELLMREVTWEERSTLSESESFSPNANVGISVIYRCHNQSETRNKKRKITIDSQLWLSVAAPDLATHIMLSCHATSPVVPVTL